MVNQFIESIFGLKRTKYHIFLFPSEGLVRVWHGAHSPVEGLTDLTAVLTGLFLTRTPTSSSRRLRTLAGSVPRLDTSLVYHLLASSPTAPGAPLPVHW